jgi:beta-galactosidase
VLLPDDAELLADGADATRIVIRVTDEFGNICPFANDAIKFEWEGPADIIGDNPFSLIGGTGAVWMRAQERPGKVMLQAIHPWMGTQHAEIDILPGPVEVV